MPRSVTRPDLSGALCVNHPEADYWTSDDPTEQRTAASNCGACPVIAGCRAWSLSPDPHAVEDVYTVRGGMLGSERQRVRIARRRRGVEGRAAMVATIIELRDRGGLTFEEIAEKVGMMQRSSVRRVYMAAKVAS